MNKQMKLSEHFTLGEMTKTSYHTKGGNIPPSVAIENLKNLCQNWLEDLRYSYNRLYGDVTSPNPSCRRGIEYHDSVCRRGCDAAGVINPPPTGGVRGGHTADDDQSRDLPVVINSAYRSEEVNERCGGSRTSNHLTGCAADIRCMGPEQMIRYASILLDIADGTRRDLTSSRVCSHSEEPMQALLCARSIADFDELLMEKRGTTYWIHFAVRPKDNRRRIAFDMR